MGVPLSEVQQQKIINLLLVWTEKQVKCHKRNVSVKEQVNENIKLWSMKCYDIMDGGWSAFVCGTRKIHL